AGSVLFLAGDGAPIAIAENGTTFAPGTVIGPDFGSVRAIVRHDDAYLAASARYDSGTGASRGYLLASHDGLWWEAVEMSWPGDVLAMVSTGDRLVVAGASILLASGGEIPHLAVDPAALAAETAAGRSGP